MSELTRQAIFTLRDGDIKIWFPDVIPEAEMEYVEAYFALLLQGMRRRSQSAEASAIRATPVSEREEG